MNIEEKIAEAICIKIHGHKDVLDRYIPHAQAAIEAHNKYINHNNTSKQT